MSTSNETRGRRSHADFDRLWKDVEGRDSYWENLARLQFIAAVRAHLRTNEISQVELARRLDWQPAQVSRALRGGQNLTLRSMVKMCRALGLRLDIGAVALDAAFARPAGATPVASALEVAEPREDPPGPPSWDSTTRGTARAGERESEI